MTMSADPGTNPATNPAPEPTGTGLPPERPIRSGRISEGAVNVGRVVVGLLIGMIGVGWLLDGMGVSVPWHLFPSIAVVLIGVGLLITLIGGRGRRLLVGVGVIALLIAVGVGVGLNRYSGPVGNRVLAPAAADWPVAERVAAGTVTLDLTRHPLPESGTATVDVGAGKVVVLLPAADHRLSIDARTTAGTVRVDGEKASDGVDVRWTQPTATGAGVALQLQVGLGDIEVNHEQS